MKSDLTWIRRSVVDDERAPVGRVHASPLSRAEVLGGLGHVGSLENNFGVSWAIATHGNAI